MKAASFFTGAAGFDLGFEQAGIEVVFQCEIDKFARQLLTEKYPQVAKHDDITQLHSTALPPADIYFGGFPCQDASTAGNRVGLKGKKTGLFYHFVRLIKANKPQWVVLENVPGLLSTGRRQDFKSVIETLAECGYYVSWRVLDSQYFGVSQRRRRLFLVGCYGDWRGGAESLFESRIEAKDASQGSRDESEIAPGDRAGISVETSFLNPKYNRILHHYQNLTPTLCASDRGFALLDGDRFRFPTPLECERLQGFPDHWTAGFSSTQRYKMIGNAVSVPVAKWLGERIEEVARSIGEPSDWRLKQVS